MRIKHFLILVVVILPVCLASAQQMSKFDEQAIHVLKTIYEAKAVQSGQVINVQDNIFDKDGKLVATYFTTQNSPLINAKFTTPEYILDTWERNADGKVLSLTCLYVTGCIDYYIKFIWTDGIITTVDVGTDVYDLTYNAQGKLITAIPKFYGKWADIWVKTGYEIVYNEKGDIQKVSEIQFAGSGKAQNALKNNFTFSRVTKTYTYGPNTMGFHIEEYYAKQKEKDSPVKLKAFDESFRYEPGKSIHKITYPGSGDGATEYYYDNKGALVKQVNSSSSSVNTQTYEYDDQGRVTKYVVNKTKEGGKFDSHMEYVSRYKLIDGKDTSKRCSYKQLILAQTFDEKGIVVREVDDVNDTVMERVRDVNGQWSEWKKINYRY